MVTYAERSDMTARILDVKYHILLPDAAMVGSPLDYYQWAALLKSLSGFEAYRRKYHTGMRPIDVAQHAIFEGDFPRSLQFAVDRIQRALEMIGTAAADSPSRQAVGRLLAHLSHHSAEIVLREGFHELLQGFLKHMAAFNAALQVDYFAPYLGAEPCATYEAHTWRMETLRTQPSFWSFVLHRSLMTPDLTHLQHGLELPRYDAQQPLLHSVQAAMDWIAATLTYQVGVPDVHSPLEAV